MLYQAPRLDSQELQVIEKLDEIRAALKYVARTPPRWYGLLRRNIHAQNVRASNAIEQHHVTLDDAIAAVESQSPFEAEGEDWQAVTGYQSAMTYVLQLAKRPQLVYTSETLLAMHFMMLGYDLAKRPGNYRAGPIGVHDATRGETVYTAPDAEDVPGLASELIGELNQGSDVSPVVRAAMAHLNLVLIHPFVDGNGRMSRCLQSLVLAEAIPELDPAFLSIESYLGRNTDDYYQALEHTAQGRWTPEGDARPWIRFCLTAHYRQALSLRRRTRIFQRLWDALEIEIARHELPDRTLLALSDAALGHRVRNTTYRNAAGLTAQVASRDLTELARVGLLEMRGRARGAHYVAGDQIREIASACDEPRDLTDPFEGP